MDIINNMADIQSYWILVVQMYTMSSYSLIVCMSYKWEPKRDENKNHIWWTYCINTWIGLHWLWESDAHNLPEMKEDERGGGGGGGDGEVGGGMSSGVTEELSDSIAGEMIQSRGKEAVSKPGTPVVLFISFWMLVEMWTLKMMHLCAYTFQSENLSSQPFGALWSLNLFMT